MEKIGIERTKRGLPAVWERGGGMTNTGDAQIVAGKFGQPKRPVYVRQRGPLACEDHALFVIHEGDIIVRSDHHRGDHEISVYRVETIYDDHAEVRRIHHFSYGEWDSEPPEELRAAIEAAMDKAECYHCREPHYMTSGEEATA